MKKNVGLVLIFLALTIFWTCTQQEQEVAVSSVTISQPTAEMIVGETVKLSATFTPSNATDKDVIWASSKQSVATVDKSGVVTAIAEGASNITASAGGKVGTCVVTVSKKVIVVSSIELNKNELALVEEEEFTLVATVKPDDATDKTVSWNSSEPSVATVAEGKVKALKEGAAIITAKAGEKSTTCSLIVAKKIIAVESISLNKTELSLTKGQSETLVATVKPDDATQKTVSWSSSNTGVATVENGEVTAVGGGKATITAQVGEVEATCIITVTVPVSSITLNNTNITLIEGEETTLVATIKPDDATDKTVRWASDKTSIVVVEQNGKVTAVQEGSATITASAGDKTATCSITVQKKGIEVTKVTFSLSSLTLTEGKSYTLIATVHPSNATDKTVYWSSSNPSIVTVSDGTVTAKAPGTATIVAQAGDKTANCTVTVIPPSTEPETVDLGLSVKWASFNVGASSPEEYGDYYAWGETSDYSESSYKWCDGTSGSLTKYNTQSQYGSVDNKTVLELSDDAAYTNWGGSWRMPTDAEWTELRTKCTWTWTTLNGVNGCKVTSQTNGNSIFLPAAGYRGGTTLRQTGTSGDYRSSSLNSDSPTAAWGIVLNQGGVYRYSSDRRSGQSVRPVYDDYDAGVPVASVNLNMTSLTLTEGERKTLIAAVYPSNATDKTITWSSSNTAIATVSNAGDVMGISEGEATITASCGGKSAYCSVNVSKKVIPVTSITISKTALSLKKGDAATLIATVSPSDATDKSVSWSTSDVTIASISQDGLVTAIKSGTATITAKAGEKSVTCSVTVTTPVESVSLSKTSASIEEGKSITLVATITPSDADDKTVVWTTSDNSVATVSNGVVTGVVEGTCTITATVGGKSAECNVTVKKYTPSGGHEGTGEENWD